MERGARVMPNWFRHPAILIRVQDDTPFHSFVWIKKRAINNDP